MGLDPLRANLTTALLLTASTALVSAMICRQRLGAIVGAGLACGIGYILPFVRQEQLPVFDPGRHIEALNTSALEHTAIAMLAGGLLSAFIGAAVGSALGEVLLDPIWLLGQLLWQTLIHPFQAKKQLATARDGEKRGRFQLYWAWTGLLATLGLLMLSSGIGDLFAFSPDVGLHNPPVAPTHSTCCTAHQEPNMTGAKAARRCNPQIH
jgi:hypothetical protein